MPTRRLPAALRKSSLLEGLVAYWPLNEPVGTMNAADLAGGHDLIYTAGTPDMYANAGNTYQMAREQTPYTQTDAGVLKLYDNAIRLSGTHTWACWFLAYTDTPYSAPHLYNIPWFWIDGSGGEDLLLTNASSMAYQAGAGAGGADNRSLHTVVPGTLLNTWHLSICEYDHATQTYKQLVDNTSETVDVATGKTFRAGSAIPLYVGAGYNGSNVDQSWDGLLGPLMYWARLLSAEEKSELWNGGRGWRLYGRKTAPPLPWYYHGGVMPIAAYQPKGAVSQAESLINLVNRSTYTVKGGGGAPSWAAATGWTFNGSTDWYSITATPTDDWSFVIRISGGTDSASEKTVFGSMHRDPNGAGFRWIPSKSNQMTYSHGGSVTVSPGMTAGVAGVAGQQGYRNGVADGDVIAGDDVAYHTALGIGAMIRSDIGPDKYWNGNVQALAIYDTTLTAAQMLAVSQAMAAL